MTYKFSWEEGAVGGLQGMAESIVLQEFQRSIQESLQNLIHAEDDSVEIISSTLIGLDQFILKLP